MQIPDSDNASFQDQSIAGLYGPIVPPSSFSFLFSFDGSISNYSEQVATCGSDPFDPCVVETWSGIFSGGTVSFGASNQEAEYTFTGAITGGSFAGELVTVPDDILGENRAMFSFISTSTSVITPLGQVLNGWRSEGTFSISNCVGFCGGRRCNPDHDDRHHSRAR